jgi:hypothetical protein
MKAQNLREGAIFYRDGRPAIVVLSGAEIVDNPFPTPELHKVRVTVRFVRDGGQEPRWFNVDDEVPYENIDPRDED